MMSFSPLPGDQSRSRRVGKLPVTWGKAVDFLGTLDDEFLTTAWGPIQVKACGKVASDLG